MLSRFLLPGLALLLATTGSVRGDSQVGMLARGLGVSVGVAEHCGVDKAGIKKMKGMLDEMLTAMSASDDDRDAAQKEYKIGLQQARDSKVEPSAQDCEEMRAQVKDMGTDEGVAED
jgi:hypothetical protein